VLSGTHAPLGRERKSARHGTPQVVFGIGMATGKLRAGQPEDGLDLMGRHGLGQQRPRHPQIYNAPIGRHETFCNMPALDPGLVKGGGLSHGHPGWESRRRSEDPAGTDTVLRLKRWWKLCGSGP
jgi:hypothetical protein